MVNIQIRGVSRAVIDNIDERARALGMSRESWIREQLSSLALTPVIKQRYALYFSEYTANHRAMGRIVRDPDALDNTHSLLFNPSDSQKQVFDQALALVRTNALGDREQALALLHHVFPKVFEAAE
jgi:hypothetical protein